MNQCYWNEQRQWRRAEKTTRARMKIAPCTRRVLSSVLNGYNNTHLHIYYMSAKIAKPFWPRTTLQLVILWCRFCFIRFVCFTLHCRHGNCNGCCFVGMQWFEKSFQKKKLKRKHGANANWADSTNFLSLYFGIVCVQSMKMWEQFYRGLLSVLRIWVKGAVFFRYTGSYATWWMY